MGRTAEVDDDVLVAKIVDDRLQQFRKVECRALLPVAFIPEKTQRRVDHRLHFLDVADHFALLFQVFHEFAAQAHPRQGRAQVVGDRREHLCALAEKVADLCLHGVEGNDCLAYLMGAFDLDRRRAQVIAKAPCGAGKTLQRIGQLPRGNPGDQQGCHQPQGNDDRDPYIGIEPPAAFRGRERQPAAIA
ncbi:hypothetical protein D9M71_568970 [compost metagenome]